MIRKNIVIAEDTWKKLKTLSLMSEGESISSIIRMAVDNLLKTKENDLSLQLRFNTSIIGMEEQDEIEKKLASMDENSIKPGEVIEI